MPDSGHRVWFGNNEGIRYNGMGKALDVRTEINQGFARCIHTSFQKEVRDAKMV